MPAKKGPKPKKISIPEAKRLLPTNLADLKLNLREYKFVAVFTANGFDSVDAVLRAGYKPKNNDSARCVAYELQRRPPVTEALRRIIDIQLAPYKDTGLLKLFDVVWRRAFYDVSMFMDEEGELVPLEEIPAEWRCVVDGVDLKLYGTTALKKVRMYTLPNRDANMKFLYQLITGMSADGGGDGKMPEEARKRMQAIFQEGLASLKPGDAMASRVTVEQVFKKAGRGRPKEIPEE